MKISLCLIAVILCTTYSVSVFAQKVQYNCNCQLTDSLWRMLLDSQLTKMLSPNAENIMSNRPDIPSVRRPHFAIGAETSNNFLSYNLNYVSRIEGVYDYRDIVQQSFTYRTNVSLLKNMPVSLLVNGRHSNSPYLRNYVDFNIDLKGKNINEAIEQRKAASLHPQLLNQYHVLTDHFQDKINAVEHFIDSITTVKDDNCINMLIHSKEVLANRDFYLDSSYIRGGKDSVALATEFIKWYESRQHLTDSVKYSLDSLVNVFKTKLGLLKQSSSLAEKDPKLLSLLILKYGQNINNFDTSLLVHEPSFLGRFKKLSLGKSMATSSQLNFQNISINGINAEYQIKGLIYKFCKIAVNAN